MFDLSLPQKNIVEIEKFYKNSAISNIGGYAVFKEKIDLTVMERAMQKLIETSDTLRVKIVQENGVWVQYIDEYKRKEIELIKLDEKDLDKKTDEWMEKSFDFNNNLYNMKLIDMGDKQGIFIKLHHIISDAWSMSIVYSKTMQYYEQLLSGNDETDEIPTYQTFVEDEKKYLESESYLKDENYWKEKYAAKPSFVSLSASKDTLDITAERASYKILSDQRKIIEDFCKKNNISMAVFFEALVSTYATRANSTNDITLCTIGINRIGRIEKKTIGMFNNILPMTIDIDWNSKFVDLCKKITTLHFETFRHQKFPYNRIKEIIYQNHGISNIYDIMVSYQNAKFDESLKTEYIPHWNFNGCAELGFMMNIDDLQGSGILNVNIDYRTSAFTRKDIDSIYARLINMIGQIVKNDEIGFKEIEIVTLKEKNQILYEFNNTKKDYPRDMRLFDSLEKIAKEQPKKVALIFDGKTMTYGEFNERVNALANYLIKKGLEKRKIIGIMSERSFEMMIGIYAILKAGCAYMPMDPTFPNDRIAFMLEDSESPIILIQKKWKDKIPEGKEKVYIDEFNYDEMDKQDPNIGVSSKDVAYVIYTSGSTGKPKGAQIEHHSAINRVKWMHEKYPLKGEDVALQKTPYTFDVSVWELFWWSMYGASLRILVPEGHKDPSEIIEAVYESHVTHMHFVPSMLSAFLKYVENNRSKIEKLKTLRYVFASGEALQSEHVKKFYELLEINNTTLHNLYGPTECTVDVSYYDCNKDDIPDIIPIGKPVDNTELIVLDKACKLLPIGVAGELHISGVLVGRGYINRDELTKEKFIDNEYFNSPKMYKTGDLARWQPDGNIEYLGRIDNQIKIRGLRVELGDIENAILKYKPMIEAVVTVYENNGEKYLCCYYTAIEYVDESKLNEFLINELPTYMIPSYFVQLDVMPLNHNGKIDRKQLPKPNQELEEEYVAPEGQLEKTIQECVEQILNTEKISVETDLLTVGMTSLGIITLITKLSIYDIEVKVQDIYREKTIRQIAKYILEKTSKENNYDEDEIYRDVSDITNINIETKKEGAILITGATGFLGIHLLEELYNKTKCKIYCLIRKTNKFEEVIEKYTSIKDYKDRITLMVGDITDSHLGLTNKDYQKLVQEVNMVVHSAANVSFFCPWEKAKSINYIGTQNMINFAIESKSRLHHISTMSVSGDILTEQTTEYPVLTENNLYIGQLYKNNVYAHSKYLAERDIVKAIREKRLSACIYRLPNLTWRAKDGMFQRNYEENDLFIMTKVMCKLKQVPIEIENENILLAPVDDSARAIAKLILHEGKNQIYHIVNKNSPTIKGYISYLTNITEKPMSELYEYMATNYPNDSDIQFIMMYLKGILKNPAKMVVKVNSDITQKILDGTSFIWSNMDKKYVEYYKKV